MSGGWLLDKWHDLLAWIVRIKPAVLDFIKPTLQKVTEDEIAIAEAAVAIGFTTPGSGEVKMLAALAYFAAQSAAKELPYVESQARALIELALQNAKTAAAPTTPVPAT